jgi:hypothetical protein
VNKATNLPSNADNFLTNLVNIRLSENIYMHGVV